MNDKNRNLLARVVSALVLLPLVLWLLYRGGMWASGLMAVAAGICAAEYALITVKRITFPAAASILLAVMLPLLPALGPTHLQRWGLWLFGGLSMMLWIYSLFEGPHKDAPVIVGHAIAGTLFASLGMTALSVLRQGEDGFAWLVAALAITWANDTAAYFAGRLFGRHKLYPAISPNKTWEGFAGGLFGSVLGMVGTKLVLLPSLTWMDCVTVGVLGGLFGPMGDFVESMLKRAYQVKDSSQLIPGHGGLLDRIDALLFNGPIVLLYVTLVR